MKKTIKLLKAYWELNASGYNAFYLLFSLFLILISIMNCTYLSRDILNYVDNNTILSNNTIYNLLYTMIFPILMGISLFNTNFNIRKKIKGIF